MTAWRCDLCTTNTPHTHTPPPAAVRAYRPWEVTARTLRRLLLTRRIW